MDLSWSGTSEISSSSDSNSDNEEIFVASDIEGEEKSDAIKKKHVGYKTKFTTDQLNNLEKIFKSEPYLNKTQRTELAEEMGISKDSIKMWFKNKRFNEKLRSRELEIDKKLFHSKAESSSCPSIIPTSTGCERSFSSTSSPRQVSQSDNVSKLNVKQDKAVESNTVTIPIPIKQEYYQDVSPVREEMSTSTSPYCLSNASKSYKNNDEYKASAEFSIDQFKKYKHMLGRDKNETDGGSDSKCLTVQSSTSNEPKNRKYQFKPEQHHDLDDMHMKKANPNHQISISTSIKPSTSGTYPKYERIPQPPNEKVMWTPLTLPLATRNAVSVTNTSITPARTSTSLNEYSVKKGDCACSKCLRQTNPVNMLGNSSYSAKPQHIYYERGTEREKINPWTGVSGNNDSSGINSDGEEMHENCLSDNELQKYLLTKRKCKRYRSAFTTEQINYLENIFKKRPYINQLQRHRIGVALGLPDKCIKVWFQNRRMKEKVMNRDIHIDEALYHNKAWSASCPSIHAKLRGCEESGSVLYPTRQMFQPNNFLNTNTVVESYPSTTSNPFRSNQHQKMCPKPAYDSLSNESELYKNKVEYKASTEVPVDLCKKYNNYVTQHQNDNDNRTSYGSRKTTNLAEQGRQNQAQSGRQNQTDLQHKPEDLSTKTTNLNQYQASTPGPTKPNDSQSKYNYVPRYVEYHGNQKMNLNCSGASGSHHAYNINVDLKEKNEYLRKRTKSQYKRYRGPYTADQLSYLETAFRIWPYVNDIRSNAIASVMGITETSVRVWFANRQMQEKRSKGKLEAYEDLYHEKASGNYPSMIPISRERSLPVILPPRQTSQPNMAPKIKTTVEMVIESNIPSSSDPISHKNNQDISSVRDEMPASISPDSSVSNANDFHKDNAASKASEFSIDLCDKHKTITIRYNSESNINEFSEVPTDIRKSQNREDPLK